MIAFWIFLTLSDLHFALAAPVAIGEIREVRSNPEEDLRDGTATWEKRMDPNDKDQWSTNDAHLMDADPGNNSDHPDDAPGGDEKGVDAEGVKKKETWRSFPWNSDDFGTGDWGPDASYNNPPKKESDDKGGQSNVYNSDENQWSTNDAHLMDADPGREYGSDDQPWNDSDHPDETPGGDEEGVDAEGVKEKEMWGPPFPWNSDDTPGGDEQGVDAEGVKMKETSGSFPWSSDDAPGGDENDAEGVKKKETSGPFPWNSDDFGTGGWGPDDSNKNPPKKEPGGGNGNDDRDGGGGGGGGGDHAMQSSQGSAENISPGQSEHPTTPKHEPFLEKLVEGDLEGAIDLAMIIRPRNSGSGAVGTPKRELYGTVDTKSYVSDSSLLSFSKKPTSQIF
jgi:hypothetical protein